MKSSALCMHFLWIIEIIPRYNSFHVQWASGKQTECLIDTEL